MPLHFRYDSSQLLLLGVAEGVLTAEDFWNAELPDYPEGTPELFDGRAVTDVELTTEDLRQIAFTEREGPNRISAMAIVSVSDLAFGLSRMFQLLAEEAAYEIRTFRDVDAAREWLEDRRGGN